jgi:hypothetical protein
VHQVVLVAIDWNKRRKEKKRERGSRRVLEIVKGPTTNDYNGGIDDAQFHALFTLSVTLTKLHK